MTKNISVGALLLSVSFLTFTPNCYASSETTQVSALLECSASTVRPSKNKKFSSTVSFVYAKGTLTGERSTGKRPGKEVYYGTLDQNKVFKIAGRGTYYGKNNAWHSKFSGELNDKDFTVLKGSMTNFKHNGHRDCKLSFLLPPEKLSALLIAGSQTTETQMSLPAEQGRLKQEQKTAEQVQKQPDASSDLSKKQKAPDAAQQQARQEQGASAQGSAEQQKSLPVEQGRLKQEQKTAEQVQKQSSSSDDSSKKQKAPDAVQQQARQEQGASAQGSAEKQKSLPAEQGRLKQEQETAEQVQKLADASSDLSKKQKALDAAQQQARQEQNVSAQELAEKQK